MTTVYALGFIVSIVLWTASAFLPPLALTLRATGLLTELGVPLLTLRAQRRVFPGTARKLPGRYGLFVLIVLGESLVGVVNGLADAGSFGAVTLLRFVLGFLVGFGLWWVYFDNIGRREPRSRAGSLTLAFWSYLHLPLVMGVAAVGALLTHVVAMHAQVPEAGVRWLLSGAFALCYLCMAALEPTLEPETPRLLTIRFAVTLRVLIAVGAVVLAALPLPLSGLVAGLVALHLVHMVLGLRAWFDSPQAGNPDVH